MKPKKTLAALGLIVLTVSFASWADVMRGQVVGISDGDTVTVLDQAKGEHRIRLAGIDAPEKSQAFGLEAKKNLSALIFSKTVDVEWSKTDKYGRLIGKICVGTADVNLSQVSAGLAWHYKDYEREQPVADRVSYAQAELQARARRVGLWRQNNPVPPWEYRRSAAGAGALPEAITATDGCACASSRVCTGPKGGLYCVLPSGAKRYRQT